MRTLACLFLACVLLATPLARSRAGAYEEALENWTRVLERFVDAEGRIDFDGLAASSGDLDRFVAYVNAVGPSSHPEQFRSRERTLSYHINAYNALAMQGVIHAGIPADFGSIFKRLRFFKLRDIVVGGRRTSLYDYENDVIRALGEPRVHFALNCMVRGCPRLPRLPFPPEGLGARLDAAAREFFAAREHLRVDRRNRTIWLSEIMKFYTDDFVSDGRARSLISYVNEYRDAPIPSGYDVRFIPYDWTLNRQP
jgi:hypothetical protein